MKGDFTRDTFHPEKHYEAVFMQQGRVQLDADWNEQAAIVAHRDATMMADLVGRCGGPAGNAAFAILRDKPPDATENPEAGDFYLSPGRYYVDGILCELDAPVLFTKQRHRRGMETLKAENGGAAAYLIYLDVWQRHVTVHEDLDLREPALGGPDTSTRVQTVWQVRAVRIENWSEEDPCAAPEFDALVRPAFLTLTARTVTPDTESAPCTLPSSAGYRGLENQLYRVEIHTPGGLGTATFKWSRDNGSVVARILRNAEAAGPSPDRSRLSLESLGRDGAATFAPGDLVEILHDANEFEGIPGQLARVVTTIAETGSVTVEPLESARLTVNLDDGPRLRKWDRFLTIPSATGDGAFVALESGIEVRFDATSPAAFRTGDYWLIPARTASPDSESGRIEWPGDDALRPRGVRHHYARIGVVDVDAKTQAVRVLNDCRCLWPALTSVPHLFYVSGDAQEVTPAVGATYDERHPAPEPLVVGLANGHCLSGGEPALVEFRVTQGQGQVQMPGRGDPSTTVRVAVSPDGQARCTFLLDGVTEAQRVTARLLNHLGKSLSLPVVFGARLQLSERGSGDHMYITDLELGRPGSTVLLDLNKDVPWDLLESGIFIQLNKAPELNTISEPPSNDPRTCCFVTVEIPFPLTDTEKAEWVPGSFGHLAYRQFTLAGVVTPLSDTFTGLRWSPTPSASHFVRRAFLLGGDSLRRILARLILKGNFILNQGHDSKHALYLDGEAFRSGHAAGESDSEARRLRQLEDGRLSGDGRRGGDFEMWFWLLKPTTPGPPSDSPGGGTVDKR